MNCRNFVFLLAGVLSISLTENKETRDHSDDSHKEGDSYFYQVDESDAETCRKHGNCEDAAGRKQKQCWGYETGCTSPDKWFVKPHCDSSYGRRFKTIEDKIYRFWKESDFGYVKSVQDSLQFVCKPKENEVDSSSLVCSKQLTYCKAKHLYMDFTNGAANQDRSQSKVFKPQKIGGFCEVDSNTLSEDGKYRMELSSWLNEVEDFSSLPFKPNEEKHCDVIVEKPTLFMKLDALVNMYHHFCDFFNLYVTQHVNGSFDTDVNIVLWEEHARRSLGNFGATWKVFTSNPVLYLGKEYQHKRVCFKEAIFALLPRMVFGLYYNTPLTPGCSKSGLFKAFSEHVMSSLGIIQEKNLQNSSEPIRITLLSRGTKFRKILNEKEIIHALETYPGVKLNVSQYSWDVPFLEQLKRSHNTDIFIGMHGAGLSHALFLPDWANLFELYNCGDMNCYRDLARLRGVSYITWENKDKIVEHTEELHAQYRDHPKFRNYAFDVREFMRLVEQAVMKVRQSIDEYNKHQSS
ncbi:hypothetical protein ACROYT_G003919 [Oculina patagonica]